MELVFKTSKGNPATDSLLVAHRFKKRHDNVLTAYKNLDVSPEFNALNFKVVEYVDKKGQKRPKVIMTRDGFTFLVMGFTGKDAAEFKEGYINQFNQMEKEVKSFQTPTVPLNLVDHIHRSIQVQNSKEANSHNYRKGGVLSIINHNQKNCEMHTGFRPCEIIKKAKEAGLPSKHRTSAKEVLRHTQPEVAASISMADYLVTSYGLLLEDATKATRPAEEVFRNLLALKVPLAQLCLA